MTTPHPSRRHFLALLGVGSATTVLAACSTGTPTATSPATSAQFAGVSGSRFVQPEVLRSADGRLELTLRAEPGDLEWGDSTRYAYTYNGSSPGPTLLIRPGDQVTIHLENGLDTDTNLHTHGLRVSPLGNSDNIFLRVAPGATQTYVYDIPDNHPSGLFWYHPHAHGTVAPQVAAGLAGAIVVTDALDDIAEIAGSNERLWILSDPPIGSSSSILATTRRDQMSGRQGPTILVNGVERPEVDATVGELERWRFVKASSSRYYRLALDDHPLQMIASDGGRYAAPVAKDELLLAPGERAEFLVAPRAPGSFALRALRYDRGGMGSMMGGGGNVESDEALVATMTVTGDGAAAPLPTSLLDAAELALPEPSATRVLELGMGMAGGGGMSFTIDGKTFDGDRTDIAIAAGTVEEWEIRNTSPMDHPLHLHVWAMLPVDDPSGWKDTINVPARQSVRVRIAFTEITGRTVYHCHILDHEDMGMMGVIEVNG
jgi:FtsP/CotA-like multicopper oxidase with cupredoxin domain